MLDGIRIIEIEGLGPAPFAGMLLADLGAEVIVVHRPEVPMMAGPERSILDRGKKSIVLDLKQADSQQAVRRLAATANGLIEGFRPGVMERLGLGPEVLQEDNPALVYGRLTGWGQDGPRARQAGHELNFIGLSGALWYSSMPGETPSSPTTMLGDIGGGALYLVAGMLSALLKAARTGRGSVVDAAIIDGSAHMMNLIMTARTAGAIAAERGVSVLDGSPWARCYRTADDRWLAVHCLEPKFYREFLALLGVADDMDLRQTADTRQWPRMADRFAALIAAHPLAHWIEVFSGSDACVAPVLSPEEAAHDPQLAARGTWIRSGDELQARAAPRFDGQRPPDPSPAPRRGEHTNAILDALDAAD